MSDHTKWVAATWDRPMGKWRYCVQRKNKAVYGGIEPYATDSGGVFTFGSRKTAEKTARELNAALLARVEKLGG